MWNGGGMIAHGRADPVGVIIIGSMLFLIIVFGAVAIRKNK